MTGRGAGVRRFRGKRSGPLDRESCRVGIGRARAAEPERIELERRSEQNPETTAIPSPPADPPSPIDDLTPEQVTKFVQDYLRDAETTDVERQLRYYSFPVDYFDHGRVDRTFVAKDTGNYVKRWPKRKYRLIGPVKFLETGKEGRRDIEFTIEFKVSNRNHAVQGKTRNFWSLHQTENLQIVTVKEQRLRE